MTRQPTGRCFSTTQRSLGPNTLISSLLIANSKGQWPLYCKLLLQGTLCFGALSIGTEHIDIPCASSFIAAVWIHSRAFLHPMPHQVLGAKPSQGFRRKPLLWFLFTRIQCCIQGQCWHLLSIHLREVDSKFLLSGGFQLKREGVRVQLEEVGILFEKFNRKCSSIPR